MVRGCERRHLGDEGVGFVFELGIALAGAHGELQELRVREVAQAQAAHVTGAARASELLHELRQVSILRIRFFGAMEVPLRRITSASTNHLFKTATVLSQAGRISSVRWGKWAKYDHVIKP